MSNKKPKKCPKKKQENFPDCRDRLSADVCALSACIHEDRKEKPEE